MKKGAFFDVLSLIVTGNKEPLDNSFSKLYQYTVSRNGIFILWLYGYLDFGLVILGVG